VVEIKLKNMLNRILLTLFILNPVVFPLTNVFSGGIATFNPIPTTTL
jgi:hypothetical protein